MPFGGVVQVRAGEMFDPSQVYLLGIDCPEAKAGQVTFQAAFAGETPLPIAANTAAPARTTSAALDIALICAGLITMKALLPNTQVVMLPILILALHQWRPIAAWLPDKRPLAALREPQQQYFLSGVPWRACPQ